MSQPNVATQTIPAATTSTPSVVVVTITSQQDTSDQTEAPVIVTAYSTYQYTPSATITSTSSRSTTTSVASNANSDSSKSSSGLGTGGTIAVAVAVPVGVLALLGLLGFLFWRRRKRNRNDLAQRKEEQDQYAFHPNDDALGAAPVMTQYDGSHPVTAGAAYRGWNPTNTTRQFSASGINGVQASRGKTAAAAAAFAVERTSSSPRLETPTLPTIGMTDDLDSVAPSSPRQPHYGFLTSPGHGSPPLDAIDGNESASSDYSEDMAQGRRAPYPVTHEPQTSNMASFMPPLHNGPQRSVPDATNNSRYAYAR